MRFRLELFVANLDASIAFYERALGVRVGRHGDEDLGAAEVAGHNAESNPMEGTLRGTVRVRIPGGPPFRRG